MLEVLELYTLSSIFNHLNFASVKWDPENFGTIYLAPGETITLFFCCVFDDKLVNVYPLKSINLTADPFLSI